MAPELVAEFITAFQVEWNRLIGEQGAQRAARERELAAVQKKLTKVIEALADGFRGAGLQQTMDELESRKLRLTEALAAPAPTAPALHPNLAALYQERVAKLHEAIRAADTGSEALELIRGLIEQVSVEPAEYGKGMEIELIGDIAAMVSLASGAAPVRRRSGSDPDLFACSVKVVAGAGFGRQLTPCMVLC